MYCCVVLTKDCLSPEGNIQAITIPKILESRILFAVAAHCLVYEDRHRKVHSEKD
jgi:hypothetical protein